MTLNLSCLNGYEDSRLFLNKSSNNIHHSISKSNGESLLSKFSSVITSSLYSSNDLQLLLKSSRINEWKVPTKLVSSIIIYSSLSILLFVTSSIIFYIISYSNLKKFQSSTQRSLKCRLKLVCIILLLIISIYILIEMIFLIQTLYKTKVYFDKSIEQINKEFNSKSFSNHLKYLLNQFVNLSKSSLIVNGSKSLMKKRFSILLNDFYLIGEINELVNNIKIYFNQIFENINLKNALNDILIPYEDLIHLNENICNSINQNHFQIEKEIFHLLNEIHQQFQFFIEIFNEQILKNVNFSLINDYQEQQIRSSISLITTLTIIIITFLPIIPISFFILITINYFCFHLNDQNNRITNSKSQYRNKMRFHYLDVNQLQLSQFSKPNQQRYPTHSSRHVDHLSAKNRRLRKLKVSDRNVNVNFTYSLNDNNRIGKKFDVHYSNDLFLNPIRIAFGLIMVLLIILCILSGIFYGLDLFLQSSCRLVHYDQTFLISFLTDHLIKSNDHLDLNKRLNNIINDCNNEIHFSKQFLEEYSNQLKDQLIPIINHLNENIYKEFLIKIKMINISSELSFLHNRIHFINIENQMKLIKKDFNHIKQIFRHIVQYNSQLSNQFLIETLNELDLFLIKVIESTIDSCPLPLNNIFQIDRLICHQTAYLINGLWLKLLFFMFVVGFVLCIFGIVIYKRLN